MNKNKIVKALMWVSNPKRIAMAQVAVAFIGLLYSIGTLKTALKNDDYE